MRQDPERFVTFVLGAFAFLYYFGLAAQIARVRRRIGRSPVVWSGGWGERARVLAAFAWPLVVIAWAQCPRCFSRFPAFSRLENWPARLGGLLLLCLAGALVATAYAELGEHWRLGIDSSDRSGFVRGGIYGSIRHPVYSALWLALLGFFFLAPNLLFALLWAAGSSAAAAQAKAEERRMAELYGKPYRDYASMTGKFFPLWY